MVRVRVSLQGMNVSQCNVLKSDGNKCVCVYVYMCEEVYLVNNMSLDSSTPQAQKFSVLCFCYFLNHWWVSWYQLMLFSQTLFKPTV